MARIHPDDRERVLTELERGLALRHVFSFDHRCVWPDGASHWIHGVGEVLIGDANEVVGAVGVALDIDERMRLLEVERTASERARFLERTNRVLIESLDLGWWRIGSPPPLSPSWPTGVRWWSRSINPTSHH